jgi:hypothetical protein
MPDHPYDLQRLYLDQEPLLIADLIAPLIAWLQPTPRSPRPPFTFAARVDQARRTVEHTLHLTWDTAALEQRTPGTLDRVRRIRSGRTADRERLAETAAYALALVAVSVWMPGRRACRFNNKMAPDIVLDDTDGALRGVEVAGRTRGGFGALRVIAEGTNRRPGKRAELLDRDDIAEAHLSLWSGAPRATILLQVKP